MSSAGEFGHMLFKPRGRKCRCGAQGCVEAYAGDYAIIGAARPELRDQAIQGNLSPETFLDLAEAARNGDEAAIVAFRTAGEAIGSGLASLFSIIDPLPIGFVGDGASALDLMEPTIREVLATSAVRNITSELAFRSFPNETQLILEGCSMTSLQYLDTEFFAHSPNADTVLEHSE
jgi:predicted NBD/HSP70 family sugar kinase